MAGKTWEQPADFAKVLTKDKLMQDFDVLMRQVDSDIETTAKRGLAVGFAIGAIAGFIAGVLI